MLNSCSYLYDIEGYRAITELITSQYLVSLDQYSPPAGISNSQKARLFCYGLGNFYATIKEHTKSFECYDKALEIEPNNTNLWYVKDMALYNLGKYEEAIKYFDKALEINPNDASAWYNKGNALFIYASFGLFFCCGVSSFCCV